MRPPSSRPRNGVGVGMHEWNVRDQKYKGLVRALADPRLTPFSSEYASICVPKNMMAFHSEGTVSVFDVAAGNLAALWSAPKEVRPKYYATTIQFSPRGKSPFPSAKNGTS